MGILLRATHRKTLGAREQAAEKAWWEDRCSSNKGSPQPSVAPLSQHFPVRQQWNHIWRVYWWPIPMGHTMTSLKHFLNLKHSWYTITEVHPSPIFSQRHNSTEWCRSCSIIAVTEDFVQGTLYIFVLLFAISPAAKNTDLLSVQSLPTPTPSPCSNIPSQARALPTRGHQWVKILR